MAVFETAGSTVDLLYHTSHTYEVKWLNICHPHSCMFHKKKQPKHTHPRQKQDGRCCATDKNKSQQKNQKDSSHAAGPLLWPLPCSKVMALSIDWCVFFEFPKKKPTLWCVVQGSGEEGFSADINITPQGNPSLCVRLNKLCGAQPNHTLTL